DRELAALATQPGVPLARCREALFGFPARSFRGESALPRELGRARGFLCVGRGSSEIVLRRLEATTGVALLRDERTQTRLLFGDAPLGGPDLLAQRVADAARRAASLLHRRRLKPRFLGTFRSGVVRVDRHLLAPLGRREDVGSGVPRRRRNLPVTRPLLPPGHGLRAL